MLSANSFRNMIENSNVYNIKLKLGELNYEDLLNKSAGQQLLIEDLENAHIEHIDKIVELEMKLDDMTSKYYLEREKNKKLEASMLALLN